MRAADIMTRTVITVHPDTDVRDAAALMAQHDVSSLPVLDEDGAVIGIVSEIDVLRDRMPHDPRVHLRPMDDAGPDPARHVREVMTSTVVCLSQNCDAGDLAETFVESRVRAVPILDGSQLVGIVSRRDVLRTLLRDDAAIRAEVCERLDSYAGRGRWVVDVQDGVVTIHDHYVDEREREAVMALTRTVAGVLRVHATGRRG